MRSGTELSQFLRIFLPTFVKKKQKKKKLTENGFHDSFILSFIH